MRENFRVIGTDNGIGDVSVSSTNVEGEWHHAFSYTSDPVFAKSATPKVQSKTKVKAKRRKAVLKKHK